LPHRFAPCKGGCELYSVPEILADPTQVNRLIIDIALDSEFNDKNTFYR